MCVTGANSEGRKSQGSRGQLETRSTTAKTAGDAMATCSSNTSVHSQIREDTETPPIFTSETPLTATSELTSLASLPSQLLGGATVTAAAHQEMQMRTPPTRQVAAGDEWSESELEISQKTWSAYESLPRGLAGFREGESYRDQRESERELTSSPDDIGTHDNSAYSCSQELESLRRSAHHEQNHTHTRKGHTHQLLLLSGPQQRVSAISVTSTGSGYVINSLTSPPAPLSPRERGLSAGSEGGYVINSLEWACGRGIGASHHLRAAAGLPRIVEDGVGHEYLQIVPS